MSTLVVKQIGGAQIGKVSQSPDGSIIVKSDDAASEQELNLLFRRMIAEPLELWGGQVAEVTDGGMKCTTIVQIYQPGDDNYLHALADTISHNQLSVAGQRIRGYVIEE
jgi:hypothetical protein